MHPLYRRLLCVASAVFVLASSPALADDTPVGPLQLVQRTFAVSYADCEPNLIYDGHVVGCRVEVLERGVTCHDYEIARDLPNPHLYTGDLDVEIKPDVCGYSVYATRFTQAPLAQPLVWWIQRHLQDHPEVSFYVYTL